MIQRISAMTKTQGWESGVEYQVRPQLKEKGQGLPGQKWESHLSNRLLQWIRMTVIEHLQVLRVQHQGWPGKLI